MTNYRFLVEDKRGRQSITTAVFDDRDENRPLRAIVYLKDHTFSVPWTGVINKKEIEKVTLLTEEEYTNYLFLAAI